MQPADQVVPDDMIVQSSLCVGFDCVDGESFGFDTLLVANSGGNSRPTNPPSGCG